MMMITKSQVKYIQSLGQKKVRDQEQVFVAEGPKIINELLAEPAVTAVALFAVEEWWQQPEVLHLKNSSLGTVVSVHELERISFLSTANQVLGIFSKPHLPQKPRFLSGISLMLDDIQDPGNLGTIIRTADWFGITQLVCSFSTADAYAPKVIQSTMGSIARVNLCYADLDVWLQENPDARIYATALTGTPLSKMGTITNGVIVIGNESNGVRPSILKRANEQITIPRTGKAESLNAAVAAGIILSRVTA